VNVNLDNIPKVYGFGANKNKKILDWKNSVGKIVNVTINVVRLEGDSHES